MSVEEMLLQGADREELRFRAFCADRLAAWVGAKTGRRKVLDASAGVGTLTVAMAQAVGPEGRITAVDNSEILLGRLEEKIRQFGIENIDVHALDGVFGGFRHNYFDTVACSLAWRMNDPAAAARDWCRVLRPGGDVYWGVLDRGALQPMADLLRAALLRLGIKPQNPKWMETATPEQVIDVLADAGFQNVVVEREPLGYHLRDVMGWWQVVVAGPLCEWLLPLSHSRLDELRTTHLEEVGHHLVADGLWLDVPVLLARGSKPGS